MRSILTQFHATPAEIVDFLAPIPAEFGLVMTIMTLRPFNISIVENTLTYDDVKASTNH